MTDQSRLTWALVASILLHGLLLALLPWMRQLRADLPRPPALLDVDVLPLSKSAPPPPVAAPQAEPQAPAVPPPPAIRLPDRQIVSPSDAGEEKPPDNTRLLSDRDNTVKEESVQRAPITTEPKANDATAKRQAAAEAAAAAKRDDAKRVSRADAAHGQGHTQVAALPKLDQLLPAGDLLGDAGGQPERAVPAAPSQSADARRQLFTGNSEVFSSRPGISDFLPRIRDSDITLLNTKAERFAPFVRRVAGRVFQHLDIRLRQSVSHAQLQSGREYAVVEAVMSRKGQLVGTRVIERQSTSSLNGDRVLLSATEPDTFFDANPPAGAEANDGNIHFILLIDLMVNAAADPRSGRIATGYHGIAGVGLDSAPGQRGAHAD